MTPMIGGTPGTTITAHAFMTPEDRYRLRAWLKDAELDGLRIREMTFNHDATLTIRFVARREDGKLAVLHNCATRTAAVIEGVATFPLPTVPFPPISYREAP